MLSFGLDRHMNVWPLINVTPSEKCVPGRCADGRSGVVLVESHPFGRQAIEVRGLEMFLTVDAQIPVTEIVSQHINDVWPRSRYGGPAMRGQQGERDSWNIPHR